jgi:isocitrate dehydrogenase kinase/phosphatase
MAVSRGDLPSSRLANLVVPSVLEAYDRYAAEFTEITRRAQGRFERREWAGEASDATERLDLYGRCIDRLEAEVRSSLGRRIGDRALWAGMKALFSGQIADRPDCELAETFFNSLTRRVFATVGVDSNVEFVDSDFEVRPATITEPVWRLHAGAPRPAELVERVLVAVGFRGPFADLGEDSRLAGERLAAELRALDLPREIERAEVVRVPFFRRKAAYLVGRLFAGGSTIPFALALVNGQRGIRVDAVLTDQEDISIVFSFTRSHFHVDLGPAHDLVEYLRLLMPKKPVAEIYIALGHHKHGKTELYRGILRHLRRGDDRFELAPGTPGMVMVVFALPGYDVVFKVIRDRFPAIKPVTAASVRQKYRLVFRHDRAGRLVEAQEFEHLEFDRERFSERLLEELDRAAARTVGLTADRVIVHHAYVERRVTPLDVYIRRSSPAAALQAVADFGQAVKDLAANNVFPGELLPKNFGLTRHMRVVCYDYDELGLLTDFSFRELPEPRDEEDDLSDEAWFGAAPRDVFPAELQRFLTLPPDLACALEEHHPELYAVAFWQEIQRRLRSGEIIDVFPYSASLRLRP